MPETQLFRTPLRRTVALTLVVGLALGLFATAGLAAAAPASASVIGRQGVAYSAVLTTSVAAADTTLAEADTALSTAASTVEAVAASGLDLGADTTIYTSALDAAITALTDESSVSILDRAELTADVTSGIESVTAAAAALQTRLDEAVAAKEAADAAAALALANTPDGARATARQIAADQYGWGDDQFSCLNSLWHKESGWNYQAYNSNGGATGIPQALPGSKMASFGTDWQTNATTQIKWGLDYISNVYGTPCSAWGHSQSVNWY